MSFTRDLERFRQNTMERYSEVHRASCFDLFSAIIMSTPVDQGVLRNNWFTSIGNPPMGSTDERDPSGQGTINRVRTTLTISDGMKDVIFTNNLPYGERIEFDGHSAQAPEGMVRVNLGNWDSIVASHVRGR